MSKLESNTNENLKVIKPHTGGQTNAFGRGEFEVFYGGAAGPGKTWWLVIDALGLQYRHTQLGMAAVQHPDYRGILFRRETPQLGDLIDEAKRYYLGPPFYAKYVSKRVGEPGSIFDFPSGAKIYCAHIENEDDKHKYDGFEFQFAGFDELTQFLLTQYMHIFSRCRSVIPFLPPRVRATSNPVGIGLVWVKKRFIKNGSFRISPNTVYYFIPDDEKDIKENPTGIQCGKTNPFALSRVFIPGNVYDNKTLMNSDPAYISRIMAMGKRYRLALLNGDWDAFSGDFFDDLDTSYMGVEPFMIPTEWYLEGSIDPGYSSPCSFGLRARDFEGNIYKIFNYYAARLSPDQHATAIMNRIKTCPWTRGRMPERIVAGADAWAKKDKFSIQASETTFADIFEDAGLHLERAVQDRIMGWWLWKTLMRRKQWFYFKGMCDPMIDEMQSVVCDENDPEDILGKGNDVNVVDHALDEERMGLFSIAKPTEKEIDKLPEWAKRKWKRSKTNYSVEGV